ncbi:acyl-CoA thioesterase [Streptomyces sp. NPDC059690]|uniref:Thioesterase family protein n=1 Tax=Streptomyces gilvifuscus TaxID=1550617 RepID=A0ABT5FLZ3_9ACTN|nr:MULTISPECIES: thioesterase family protein [Streptomyces]MBK3642858.1 acyl-CoA thioesterase [Streptomyces sp. MBT33]MDC2953547.1 thioesterase family protein [Streptomyces gilvifuscus]
MRHLYRCPLRWSDMDAYGHVNNAVFVRYLEEARIDFLFRPEKDFKQGSVVARHEIDYKRQLVHRHHPVDIELWVSQIRAASFTITYEVKDDDVVYVRASTVVVPFDFEAQRPRRITAEEREFLEEYRDDSEEEAVAA